MAEISRETLFGKLHRIPYEAIESATLFCKLRGNPYVELSHWLNQLLGAADSDLHRINRHFQVDPSRLAKDVTDALARLPRGATSISDLSTHVEEAVERGWVYGSLLFGASEVRSGHLVVGMLKTSSLRNALQAISKEFSKVKVEALSEAFDAITSGSPEASPSGAAARADGAPAQSGGAPSPAALGKREALARFASDLTERARKGELDPIVGRDEEVRQIIQILLRRRQNNPILTGDAGVGKTAVAEGFAQRIAKGEVPEPLCDVTLYALDIGLLQAGASMKGEFENRLRQVIEEVQASPKPIILFIDEAHMLIGAGGSAGTGDAANLLKPALARGNLRTIAATTWTEYKKHIENDPALTRRFQVVPIDEPSEDRAIRMMRGVVPMLEKHHKVHLLEEAIEASVKLSKRYIPARQLPDKCFSLLDTACAKVAMSQHTAPAEVEDCQSQIGALKSELEMLRREAEIGIEVGERNDKVKARLAEQETELARLEQRWHAEKNLVDRVLEIRTELRKTDLAEEQRQNKLETLRGVETELRQAQGEAGLVLPSVAAHAVATVVADWTGIPVGRMVQSEIEAVLKLGEVLGARVIGQAHALDMIAHRIRTARAGLENPNKPIGVFLLAGPSGVGKTETALALAEALYGGEENVITINMSEFQESHTVSTLKGAPPGYVGYGEGGVLTEAVRRRPYSIVLLDEIEKAHPDVHEIFFQVFDKGWMEDGQGTRIDFKNTIILLTTNVGSELIMAMSANGAKKPPIDEVSTALREPLLRTFPAALLGRMVAIPYYPLDDEMLGRIVRLQLSRIERRVQERYQVPFRYDDAVVELVVKRCTEVESGGRMIDAVLTNTLLPEISRELLVRSLEGRKVQSVTVGVAGSEFRYGFE